MNRSRFLATLLVASVPALSGCATGGGGGGGGGNDRDAYRESEHTRNAELYLTQAELAEQVDKFQLALDAAMTEIGNDPGNALGHFQAGRAQIGLRDYVAADSLLNKALALYPDYRPDVDIYRETAWIGAFNASTGLEMADIEESLRLLNAAEMIFPRQRPEALMNMGVLYEQLGRNDEAIDAFGAALEIIRGPQTGEMMQRDSMLAQGWLNQEASLAPNRARLLSLQERYLEAANEYEAHLARHPGDISALSQMAAALAAGGMADSAQAIYDHLLAGEDMEIGDLFNIGVGLYLADDFVKAAEAFQKVVDVSRQNRDALLNLTTSLYQANEWAACAPAGLQLVDLDPYGGDNYVMLARCLSETGQEQEAGDIINAYENLAFTITSAALTPNVGGGGSVTANLTNKTLEPGTMITIVVHFNGGDGTTVGTSSLRVEAPGKDETTSFRADLTSDKNVVGYYFLVVPPRS